MSYAARTDVCPAQPRAGSCVYPNGRVHEEDVMRVVACTLIALGALVGPAATAVADPLPPAGAHQESRTADGAGPQPQVSMLAVALTAGGAVAAASSGVALAVNRRRAVSRRPSRESG